MIEHKSDKRQKQYTLLLLIGMMSSILLAACISRPQSHAEYTLEHRDTDHHEEDSHDETESLSVGHVHHHHVEDLPQTPWTLGMAEQLRQQMMAYRPSDQGHYQEYFFSKPLDWQGIQIPQQITQEASHVPLLKVTVDGQAQELLYSQTAEEEGWKIVAIFSNQNDEQAQEKHTYLFVMMENQQATILELQTVQGGVVQMTSKVASELETILLSLTEAD